MGVAAVESGKVCLGMASEMASGSSLLNIPTGLASDSLDN